MILVDSSTWIEFDRASGSRTDIQLRDMLDSDREIASTEPVLMEVLAGARGSAERRVLRSALTSCHWLSIDPTADFDAAAKVYSDCRTRGVTPRNLIDCLIAVIAIRTTAEVLTADRDFAAIARVLPLRLA